MRVGAILCVAALAVGSAATARTPSPNASSPAGGAATYAVVQGASKEAATAGQKLTVICPAGRRAFSAGYSALVRTPAKPGQPARYGEGGLDDVRSMPDAGGAGWQVSGISPDAVRLKQPWRLVVRVVCVKPDR